MGAGFKPAPTGLILEGQRKVHRSHRSDALLRVNGQPPVVLGDDEVRYIQSQSGAVPASRLAINSHVLQVFIYASRYNPVEASALSGYPNQLWVFQRSEGDIKFEIVE